MSFKSEGCPISFEPKINSTILRLNAIFYMSVLASAIYFNMPYLMFILIILFISKNINPKFECLLDIGMRHISYLLKLKEKLIDPAPKKLANALGLLGSTLIFILLVIDSSFAMIPATLLAIAFFLEACFDYCLGCKLYSLVH